jgi:hypothetical protein
MPAKKTDSERSTPPQRKRTDEDVKRVINDSIAALLNAYHAQQQANRKQQEQQERSKGIREIATLAFVVVTAIGVFLQAYILHQSDSAFQISARATKDAADAAKQSADALRSAERPHVLVHDLNLNWGTRGPTIDFRLKNYGRTVARMNAIQFCIMLNLTHEILPSEPAGITHDRCHGSYLGDDIPALVTTPFYVPVQVQSMQVTEGFATEVRVSSAPTDGFPDGARVYVYGALDFRDSFDPTLFHYQTFCFYYRATKLESVETRIRQAGPPWCRQYRPYRKNQAGETIWLPPTQ